MECTKVLQKNALCYSDIVQHIHKLDGIFAESILCSIKVDTGVCSIRLCLDAAEASKLIPVCAVLGCVWMLLAYAALIHISRDGVWGRGVVVGVQQLYITQALNLEATVGGPCFHMHLSRLHLYL